MIEKNWFESEDCLEFRILAVAGGIRLEPVWQRVISKTGEEVRQAVRVSRVDEQDFYILSIGQLRALVVHGYDRYKEEFESRVLDGLRDLADDRLAKGFFG